MSNETNTPNETIIRKIQKLLALGKRGGTEAEASAAMDMAQDLLAKYNLDLALVENTAVEGGTVVVEEKREKTKVDRSAMYGWQRDLMKRIAESNFCWYWTMDCREPKGKPDASGYQEYKSVKRHVILGRETNVAAVRFMYEYLAETLEALMPFPSKDRLSRSAISWREGAAERLAERIESKAREMKRSGEETKTSTGTQKMGLVLASLEKKEYASNYDAVYGKGAWDAYQARLEKYRVERAAAPVVVPKPLTAKEKAKQERDSQRYWDKQDREQQRKQDRRDHTAYRAGRVTGDSISLQDRITKKGA